MSLTRTVKIGPSVGSTGLSAENFGTGVYTSPSFTPSANSLLVIIARAQSESNDGFDAGDMTVTPSTGTYTNKLNSSATPSGWAYGVKMGSIPIGGSPVAMTIALDAGAFNIHQYKLEVIQYLGYDTSTPIGGSIVGTDADGDGTASITLSSAPATSSEIVSAATTALGSAGGAPGITPGASFTELHDTNTDGWSIDETATKTGTTSTTVDWADLSTAGGVAVGAVLLAMEIKAAAGGSSITGTGALTTGAATSSGSALKAGTASGNPTGPKATASGAGIVGHTGTGAVTAPHPATVLSTQGANKTGSGAITSSISTSAGTGSRAANDSPGQIDIVMGTPGVVAGVGNIGSQISGSGSITSSHAAIAGAASKVRDATGALTAPHPNVVAGVGAKARALTATGSIVSAGGYILNGTSSFGHTGTGALNGPRMVVNGVAPGVTSGSDTPMLAARPTHIRAVRSAHGRPLRNG